MIVSVTEVQSFKRCRRQWDYASFNRQGLTPIIQPKPYLDLGTMVHKTLAYWIQQPDLGTKRLRHIFTEIAAAHYKNTVQRYIAATGQTPSAEDMDPLLDAIALGTSMMENYQTHYGTPLPNHLRFCAPEQEILIPIPNTEHTCKVCEGKGYITDHYGIIGVPKCNECDGTGTARHYLKARLDGLAQDTQSQIYVIENKTYDKRPDLALLEASDQFIGYVWTAQQIDLGPVVGIAYNGLWKRAAPPTRPKGMTLTDLFVRTIITPAQDEVLEYGRELAQTVVDMANEPRVYKNRQWQGCWDCSYEHLCRIQSQNGDTDYVKRTQFTGRVEDDVDDIVASLTGSL